MTGVITCMAANEITEVGKKRIILLSSVGAATYKLISIT